MRIVAAIEPSFVRRVQHRRGAIENGDLAPGPELPDAALLLIKTNTEGTFLYRLTNDGSEITDTWHTSVEAAQRQAEFEFGSHLSEWWVVPEDVDDPVSFALMCAGRARRN